MNTDIVVKPVKERDNLDLLNLVCELSARYSLYNTKELHDALLEARKELIYRLSPSAEVKEQQGENELRNIAEYYFHNHKQTFKGINAGDYIDKEDWDGFIDTLIKHLNQ